MVLERTLEPEVMESTEEALSYDAMDHCDVNRCFVSDFFEFVDASSLTPQTKILDLGTGTAQIPLLLCQELSVAPAILACDLSLEMLRVAQRNTHEAGQSGAVVPIYANARRLPIADCSCRCVISNSIIHHIPAPETVLLELRRIAAPGAVIFFRDLLRPRSEEAVEHLVQQWAAEADDHQQQMFRESLHAALTLSEVKELLEGVGFSSSWASQTSDRHWTIAGRVTAK